jgi:hypothetical protein
MIKSLTRAASACSERRMPRNSVINRWVAIADLSRMSLDLQLHSQMITTTTFATACAVNEALERFGLSHGVEQHDGLARRTPRHRGVRAIPDDPDSARPFLAGAPEIVVGFGQCALQTALLPLHARPARRPVPHAVKLLHPEIIAGD